MLLVNVILLGVCKGVGDDCSEFPRLLEEITYRLRGAFVLKRVAGINAFTEGDTKSPCVAIGENQNFHMQTSVLSVLPCPFQFKIWRDELQLDS